MISFKLMVIGIESEGCALQKTKKASYLTEYDALVTGNIWETVSYFIFDEPDLPDA